MLLPRGCFCIAAERPGLKLIVPSLPWAHRTGTPSYEALVYDHGVHVLLALAVLGPQTSSTRDKPNPLEAECIPELETGDVVCSNQQFASQLSCSSLHRCRLTLIDKIEDARTVS